MPAFASVSDRPFLILHVQGFTRHVKIKFLQASSCFLDSPPTAAAPTGAAAATPLAREGDGGRVPQNLKSGLGVILKLDA